MYPVTRTVYDGPDRVVSLWVGTNNSPPTDEWSPDNNVSPANMIRAVGNAYDGGGVGDSNLTGQAQYPGGTAANRWKNHEYVVLGTKSVEDQKASEGNAIQISAGAYAS